MGISLWRSSVRGNWRGGSFTGDPENMLSKALENGRVFPQGPRFWGKWRDAFLGPWREGIHFLFGGVFIRNLRDL
jgi:hypothetical protein